MQSDHALTRLPPKHNYFVYTLVFHSTITTITLLLLLLHYYYYITTTITITLLLLNSFCHTVFTTLVLSRLFYTADFVHHHLPSPSLQSFEADRGRVPTSRDDEGASTE